MHKSQMLLLKEKKRLCLFPGNMPVNCSKKT